MLRRGPHISAAMIPKTLADLQREASELLTHSHITYRHIELNFLKIDRSETDVEVLKNIKLSIQRLGASVFAIKLSLEQTVIYQGVFKFLTDGADKILDELKSLLSQVKGTYAKVTEFIVELTALAEKGGRFSRLVGDYLSKAFAEAHDREDRAVILRVQTTHTSEAILCATATDKNTVLMAGKNGNAWIADPASTRFIPRFRLHDRAVTSLAILDDNLAAVGTDDGLEIISLGNSSDGYAAGHRERVVAITVPPWGAKGSRGAIVTGSREGVLRRWTLAGHLTQFSTKSFEKIGRRVQCLVSNGAEVIASNANELFFVDSDMRTKRTMRVPFEVKSMAVMDMDTLIICGEGNITHVNLTSGLFKERDRVQHGRLQLCGFVRRELLFLWNNSRTNWSDGVCIG